MTAGRARRHDAILRLLAERPIASQGELAEALSVEGLGVTQSTLSRDLKDLRVVRAPTADGYRYRPAGGRAAEAAPAGMRAVVAAEVLAVLANENLVVVRTRIGRASGVAAFLDARRPEGVLATLAGDDTILVVPARVDHTAELANRLREALGQA